MYFSFLERLAVVKRRLYGGGEEDLSGTFVKNKKKGVIFWEMSWL